MDYRSYRTGEIQRKDKANGFNGTDHLYVFNSNATQVQFDESSSGTSAPHIYDSADTLFSTGFDESRPSHFIALLTFLASISGFMFGYDTGYISSALVVIGDDLGGVLSYADKELITSATSLGALISSVFAGIFADLFGRKMVMMVSNILFIVGAVLQCGAHSVRIMISGRLIMGFGVGFGSLIAPLYISELAPTNYRGRLVVINVLAITGGQLVAYFIGAGIDNVHNGWRILIGISLIPCTIQLVMFIFMPDTPRYLIMKNRLEEATSVLQRVCNSSDLTMIDAKVHELYLINSEISGSNVFNRTWNSIKEIHMVSSNLRALVLGCGLQGIQQLSGWNALMYFSATIFEAIGFNNPTAVSIIIAGTNFIFTVVAFFIIDKVGRRRVLLFGLPLMMCSLILCSISFHYLGIKFEGETQLKEQVNSSLWSILVIIGMILFASGFAVGIGNVPWQQSELFPQNVRGVGASYATATNWAGSLVISSTFLSMLKNITPTGAFLLFALLTFVSILFVYFLYPELSGLDLEEVQSVLTDGFNVEMSLELSKSRRQEDDGGNSVENTNFGYDDGK